MLWWVFCAILLLSPLILFVALDIARNRYLHGPSVRKTAARTRPAPGALPQLREATIGLEAQFLVAPLRAIREAEMSLFLSGRPCPPPHPADDLSPDALRNTFEQLLLMLEEPEKAGRHPARNA